MPAWKLLLGYGLKERPTGRSAFCVSGSEAQPLARMCQSTVIRATFGIDYRYKLSQIIRMNSDAQVADDVFVAPEG